MANTQAQADVEQGHRTRSSGDASRPPRADGHHHPADSMNEVVADEVIVLSFRNLQLKRIGALQDKLISFSLAKEPLPPNHAEQVDEALRAYAQALRNYETLSVNAIATIPIGARLVGSMGIAGEERRAARNETFSELLAKLHSTILHGLEPYSTTRGVLRTIPELELVTKSFHIVAQHASIAFSPSSAAEIMEGSCGTLGFRELDQRGRVRRAVKLALKTRIWMGLFGGTALIVPVFIMVFWPSQDTNLITVSAFTLLFAIFVANMLGDGTGKDVLAATAAYTAVLVVFLGASLDSTQEELM